MRIGEGNKAQELYDYLLRFSSENAVVRKAQSHGVCTYTKSKQLWKRTLSGRLVIGLMAGNLSEEKLRIARNEIYACHGRRFNDDIKNVYQCTKSV